MIDDTPQTYAKHLATYIPCPKRIQTMTRNYFGRAPSLEVCQIYRADIDRQINRFKRIAEHKSHRPATLFKCGHPREGNTNVSGNGHRRCATCDRERARKAYARKKELEALEAARHAEAQRRAKEREALLIARRAELEQLADMPISGNCTVKEIAQIAAAIFGVPLDQMTGPSRRVMFTGPRFAAYLVSVEAGYQYAPIGRRLNRDHSSVIHGTQRARDMLARDPYFAAKVDELRRMAGL